MTTYHDALDGAEVVKVSENSGVVIVWKGGQNIHIYHAGTTTNGLVEDEFSSQFVFTNSDGSYVTQKDAEGKMEEIMEEIIDG